MKLLTILAATLSFASAGQLYNQVPAEVYQAMEYQHQQDLQQKGWQAFEGGYQGHQVVQSVQHQPIQHQSTQTHHIQTAQPQRYQYQSQPQQHQLQSQLQHVHFQSQPEHVHVQSQPQHIQIQSSHFDQQSQIGEHSGQIGHSGQQTQYTGENQLNKQAKILNFQHDSDGHNYQYAYETENGIKAQEVGSTAGEGSRTQGAYSYTSDDGKTYTVTYTADENGFHPSGDHLPTPPPLSEEIARSIEHNLRDEANGIVDDGQYHHDQKHDQQLEQYTLQSQQNQQKQAPSNGLLQQLQRHNYEQSQQQQPTNVVHQVQQQKQEPFHYQQQQQQQAIRLQSPNFKQQILLQQEPQKVIYQQVQQVQQHNDHQIQQQLPQKISLRFQRQQKPIRLQHQASVVKSVEPHVEEHRHVEYVIPKFAANLRPLRTDDYVGPAPAPAAAQVTENHY